MPSSSAARMTVVPGATSTSRPSIAAFRHGYLSSSPRDHVETADDGDGVGERAAADHLGEGLVDVVAGRPHLHPPRVLVAVGDDVVAELSVRCLARTVHLARRRQDAVVDELEVVHQRFDVRVDLGLGRQRDRLVVDDYGAVGELSQCLIDDTHALADLLHSDEVAVVAVAHAPDGHVEVVLVVAGVRLVLAQVEVDAGAA